MAVKPVLLLILACGAGLMAAVARPTAAASFTCPETVTTDASRNTPSLSELSSDATNLTARSRVGNLVTDLRKNGLKPALVVDHLVGAYCPLIANNAGLSESQKADRVRRFARQVTGLAYGQPGQEELDVLVDVPLVPTVLRQVEQAATGAGMSRDTWIQRAIERQLAVP